MKRIQVRLVISFLCITLLLVIQGIAAFRNIQAISRIQTVSYEHQLRLKDLEGRLANTRLLVYKILGTMNPEEMDTFKTEFLAEQAVIESALGREGIAPELTATNFQQYASIIALQYDFSVRTARRRINGASKQFHEQLVSALRNRSASVRQASEKKIHQAYNRVLMFTFGLLAAGLLIAVGLALVLARSLIDRHQAENELKQSEEKYRTLVNTAPYGIQLTDLDGRILFSNPAHHRIQGWPQGELTGKFIWELMADPSDRSAAREYYERVVRDQPEPVIYYSLDKTKDGRLVETQINWDYIRNSAGEVEGLISIITDITEAKRAEKALRLSHQRFLTVLDSIHATIYVADMDTHEVLFMNRYMVESFGRDFTGETCWEVFRDEPGPCSHCTNHRLVREDGTPADVCVWQDRNPVTGKWYINYDRAIEWTDGRLVRLQIATDITELKQMEEELRQAHKMEAIGTLAGGIAHEFNNILGIIVGNTELALDDVPEWNPARYNLDEIKTAGLRAKDIVRQLLSFSRQTEEHLKPVTIGPVIREALRFLRSTIPATVEIRKDIRAEDPVILADATQMNQVMINLCLNAAQSMEQAGGFIEVVLERTGLPGSALTRFTDLPPGEYVSITVRDNGPGIDPDILDRVFDPFFTTKEVGKGSGMGLSVVHGIVKNHGGDIMAENLPRGGASFSMLFPVIQEASSRPDPLPATANGGTERILLLDDEPAIVNMVATMLKRMGYRVTGFSDARKALEWFEADPERVDLIITDMTMPGMTGADFSAKAMAVRSDVPIIICSGHSSLMDEDKAGKTGISAYAAKPINKSEISRLIREVLARMK